MSSNSQNINFNKVKARDIKLNQSINSGTQISEPTSKDEFIVTVNRLIGDLQKISDEHPDIEDAILELKSVIKEAKKAKPGSSTIKRFLNTAKGTLIDVAESITAVGAITTTITILIGTLKTIFGG